MRVTAENITDQHVLDLRGHAVRTRDNDLIALCDVAFGTRCASDPNLYRSARAECAGIINARADRNTPALLHIGGSWSPAHHSAISPSAVRSAIEAGEVSP